MPPDFNAKNWYMLLRRIDELEARIRELEADDSLNNCIEDIPPTNTPDLTKRKVGRPPKDNGADGRQSA